MAEHGVDLVLTLDLGSSDIPVLIPQSGSTQKGQLVVGEGWAGLDAREG